MSEVRYGMSVEVDLPHAEAIDRVTKALADEGFGILTEINVRDTLKKKIDVDFRAYTILGACNPTMAHEALSNELEIGLLLPCNVIVYERDDGGGCVVSAINPEIQLGVSEAEGLAPMATKVRDKLRQALSTIG